MMEEVNTSVSEASIFINGLLSQYGYTKQSKIGELFFIHFSQSKYILGTGTYSNVWLAHSHVHKKLVAIKQIDRRPNSEYLKRFLPRELDLVLHLNHPHVIRVFQVVGCFYF